MVPQLPDDLADREPVLAQLSMAAVSGLPPAGPERREREPLRLTRTPGATISGALCAADMGFTLHAATLAKRDDRRGCEALARYILRPPLAQERLSLLSGGRVRLGLKRAFSDGTIAIEMDGLAFLGRLAASVPGPGFHTLRYGGVLSAAAKWRPEVVPERLETSTADDASKTSTDGEEKRKPRSTWLPWRDLLRRSFDLEVECPLCAGPMKLKAFLTGGRSLRRLLEKLGEVTDVPQRAPPRPPPYFASQAVRQPQQQGDGRQQQAELFDEPA